MSEVHEIADGIYRISCFGPSAPVEFTQFLIKDERPLLFHTGPRRMFPLLREAIDHVLGIEKLRWLAFSHVESDESGAINELLAVAPQAAPGCGSLQPQLRDLQPVSARCSWKQWFFANF